MKLSFKIHTCSFVPVSELIPKDWEMWFYDIISDNAPFSWGDNNRTLVTAERFTSHCEDRFSEVSDDDLSGFLVTKEEINEWLQEIRDRVGTAYIDLEN